MRISSGFRRLLAGALWLAGVAVLTLRGGEVEPERLADLARLCVVCGTRGTADAILNVALFLPLGVVLGGIGRAAVVAVVAGAAVAGGIELLQTLLPGRHPSLADVVLNATGAGLGTLVYALAATRVRSDAESAPGRRGRLWGGAVGACFLAAGVLLTPHAPDDDYWGQWMPDLGWMPQYDGVVLSAELNGRPMPSRRLDRERPHRRLLEGDWELEGRIVVGPPPEAVSPILSVYDGRQREALLVGAHRDALVFREWTIGKRLRFDAPDVRVPGAFAPLQPGDTTSIGAGRAAGTTCLWLGETERCGVGVTPGRTWGLLLFVEGPPEPFREVTDLLWLVGLFLPVGFFAGGRADLAAGTALGVGGLLLATATTAVIPGPWREIAACLVGVAIGRLCLRALRAVAARPPRGGPPAGRAQLDSARSIDSSV